MHLCLAVIMQARASSVDLSSPSKRLLVHKTSNGKQWTVNLDAVLGRLSTGGGLTHLNYTPALMDVHGMHK